MFPWPTRPHHSEQTSNKYHAELHAVSAATYNKPAAVPMGEQDAHHENDDMANAGRNNQAANNKRNAGGQSRKGNEPCKRYTEGATDGT
ncbi:hypothetical protein NAF19_18055 [Mucilaginibacter sp. RT5R15]|nr:hypothetical protein [Mucilaginibacter flavidus]MCO5948808.1 hypothetical protein [Mucilaginibacter flavidus]